jgi:prepilin-type N-terminal cleavage/methylation domain-containing protein
MNISISKPGRQKGFNLLEVLIGIIVFALGIMALAQLQGGLSRSSSDANMRTIASNMAEEVVELSRGFSRMSKDPDGNDLSYADIEDGSTYHTRGGIKFKIDREVTDYYYANGGFSTTQPTGVLFSDFKLLEVTVTWNSAQEFQIDDSTSTSGRLGSGSITLTDVIASSTSAADTKVHTSGSSGLYSPEVDYNPGSRPDIISISLGQNKFKESTTPLPDVIRSDELVETRFDVVTYSQNDLGATFLRREEFRAVSCECTLRAGDSSGEGGLRPTIWNGNNYSEGEFVQKTWGESANTQQSPFCDICCRDHHDGGSGSRDEVGDPGMSRYNPFSSVRNYWGSGETFAGDHKHYRRTNRGELVLADSDGELYVEACRLVRKDGFFRVAQDLRQEGLNNFPANYLDNSNEVAVYSAYVTGSVSAYEAAIGATNFYEASPPSLPEPEEMSPSISFPASTELDPTTLPTAAGGTSQQLRSRGIYIDYLSDELRTIITCLDLGGSGDDCGVPSITTVLEVIPFYDVQLTWLARWNETPNNNPVDVTNEALEDNNTHSRGVANLESGTGPSTINAAIHFGNLGLTGTDPIDLNYINDVRDENIFALAFSGTPPPGLEDTVIAGTISSAVSGLKAADIEISASEAQCDRTNIGFECVLESGASNPRLTITNYEKGTKSLVACSTVLSVHGSEVSSGNNWTRFNLPAEDYSSANIVIYEAERCD